MRPRGLGPPRTITRHQPADAGHPDRERCSERENGDGDENRSPGMEQIVRTVGYTGERQDAANPLTKNPNAVSRHSSAPQRPSGQSHGREAKERSGECASARAECSHGGFGRPSAGNHAR